MKAVRKGDKIYAEMSTNEAQFIKSLAGYVIGGESSMYLSNIYSSLHNITPDKPCLFNMFNVTKAT